MERQDEFAEPSEAQEQTGMESEQGFEQPTGQEPGGEFGSEAEQQQPTGQEPGGEFGSEAEQQQPQEGGSFERDEQGGRFSPTGEGAPQSEEEGAGFGSEG